MDVGGIDGEAPPLATLDLHVTGHAHGDALLRIADMAVQQRVGAVTADQRIKGVDAPTLKELGIDVVISNWRGVYGAPGITEEQRKALVDMVVKATKTKSWSEAVEKNGWTPALLTGDAFGKFVDDEFASLRAVMVKAGMV